MSIGLWDWQEEDAVRLREEGKGELADLWDRFLDMAEGNQPEELKKAADLAQALHESSWEVFFRHWYVQHRLYRSFGPVKPLIEHGERLWRLAEKIDASSCPQRFCALESLAAVYLEYDRQGRAATILETADCITRHAPHDIDCHYCGVSLRLQVLIATGKMTEARSLAEEILADPAADASLRFLTRLTEAEIEIKNRNLAALEETLQRARALLDTGLEVNPDHEWFLYRLEVEARIVAGDLAAAGTLIHEAGTKMPKESLDSVRVCLSLARACADTEAWDEQLSWASQAAEYATIRQAARLASEAHLLAAEAAKALGNGSIQEKHATALAQWLPKLQSDDLVDRAQGVGAT